MTTDDIIEMAKQAHLNMVGIEELTHFANLVAAAEREACAKVCEDLSDSLSDGYYTPFYAAAIRARGQE